MICRIVDMKNKEVISVKDGCKIGCVNDVEVDVTSARIISIVVYGKLKFFGIFGREEDTVIKWENIKVIGDDTILVNCGPTFKRRKKPRWIAPFFKVFR